MATNKLILQNSSGNIGIGTTSPNISEGISGSIALTISGTTSGRNALIELNGTRTTDGQISSYIRFFNNAAATPFADIQGIRGSSNTVGSLALFTSGSERLRIDPNGNVGIGGITNPTAPIHAFKSNTSGSQAIVLGVCSDSLRPVIQFSEGADVNFGTGMGIEYDGRGIGGTNAIRFNSVDNVPVHTFMSNGWVGFGNTSPTAPLFIQHTNLPGEPYSGIIIKNTDTTGAAFTGVTADGVLQSHYRFALNGSTKWQWRCGAGNAVDDLRAYSFTLGNDIMTMTAAGHVGIGKTNPENFNGLSFGDSILDVNGAVQIRGDATNGIAVINMGGDTYRKGAIYTPIGTSDPYMALAVGSSGSSSSSAERIRILSNGNVGIGITNPDTKLHVDGGALIQGNLSLNNNNFSNFQILGYESHIIRPVSDGYGGFRFKTFDGSEAGYFLLRDTTNVDVYQEYGVTLVMDRGPITLAARGGTIGDNSDRNFIRFMTAGGVGSAQVRMTINKNGQVTMPSQPRFYAYGNVGGTHTTGSTVRFGYTLTNIGNHYSSTNGRFTAPVAGDYYFFWGHIGATADTVYRFDIYRSGTYLGELRLDATENGSAYVPNASRGIVIPMAVNDYVYIYYTSDSGSSFYPGADTSSLDFIHFGGWLLG